MRKRYLVIGVLGVALAGALSVGWLRTTRFADWPSPVQSMVCGTLAPNADRVASTGSEGWYAPHWRAAEEPLLASSARGEGADGRRVVRFTWLPTFDAPVIVRLSTDVSGITTMTATQLTGQGGYEPGGVARRVVRQLTAAERARVDAMIRDSRVFDQRPTLCSAGLDGSEWIAEAVDGSGYHYVDRWSPEDGPSRVFGMHMLGLTGWRFSRIY